MLSLHLPVWQVVFRRLITSVGGLADVSSPYFARRVEMLETISALHCCVLRVTILPTSVLTGTSDHRQSGCHWRGRTKPGLSSNSNSGPPDVERPLPLSGKRLRGGRRRIVKKRGESDRRDRWKRVCAGLFYHTRMTGGTRCPSQTFVYSARLTRPRPGNF